MKFSENALLFFSFIALLVFLVLLVKVLVVTQSTERKLEKVEQSNPLLMRKVAATANRPGQLIPPPPAVPFWLGQPGDNTPAQ